MKPDISFIFVNYRSAALLEQSLSTLQCVADAQVQAEYIIVNNDISEQAFIQHFALRYPRVKVIQLSNNIGFGGANNRGAEIAQGEVIFFINPDTIVKQANFSGLMAAFHFQPNAIYGMALTNAHGVREAWSAGRFPSLGRSIVVKALPSFLLAKPWCATMICPVDWVSGAACAVRRDFFWQIGGFDKNFFMYFEDVDFARRAKEYHGWVALYPFIVFCHIGGQSHSNPRAMKAAYTVSQQYYFKKWRPSYETVLLAIAQKLYLRH